MNITAEGRALLLRSAIYKTRTGDYSMLVNGIQVTIDGMTNISEAEISNYIDYVENQTKEPLSSLAIKAAGDDNVSLSYVLQPQKFERIRRITGYLVGTIDRWNDAKRSEEHDRIKHGIH